MLRAVGRMFGIEKMHQRFRLKKFAFAFLADNVCLKSLLLVP